VIWREYVYKILTQVSELGEKQCENVLTYLPVAFDLFPGEEVYLVADQKHQFCSPTIYKRQPPINFILELECKIRGTKL
jgi:hypothetical protein